ncbi:RNA polymerase sigma factor [Aquimarina pacifica]|uniref:RNA polymerase sigma factor n=1 Tax=Aquimarina pacifica TaxID=1296415 RepID=UPI0004713AC5|nr:hypothetical protein [Aquimarina pacifica]
MDVNNVHYIVVCAQKGNEQPFTTFLDDTYQKLKPRLLSLTKSEEDTKEVFIISMQKFWERFVINQEPLPHNSVGYIYMMCKNAWLMQKRKESSGRITKEGFAEYQSKTDAVYLSEQEDLEALENEKTLKHTALMMALDTMTTKCKLLIENEFDTEQKLKDLQEELGYQNYQALVQAKYNCKKRLIKKVYEVLEWLENQQTKGYE